MYVVFLFFQLFHDFSRTSRHLDSVAIIYKLNCLKFIKSALHLAAMSTSLAQHRTVTHRTILFSLPNTLAKLFKNIVSSIIVTLKIKLKNLI